MGASEADPGAAAVFVDKADARVLKCRAYPVHSVVPAAQRALSCFKPLYRRNGDARGSCKLLLRPSQQ